jgi:mRNA deadenylase 3'-5' endonuclease subunit Ccr4
MANEVLHRAWVPLNSSTPSISLLQFNVLADFQSDNFPFCHDSAGALPWSKRADRLLAVCLQASPDLICLEECDHFSDWFQPQLKLHGYDGFFVKKNGEDAPDGTAVFFRSSKLQLLNQSSAPLLGSQNAVFAQFQCATHTLFLSATHLKAKKGFESKRQEQGKLLLSGFNSFIAQHHSGDSKPHMLICGDFNDTPESLVVSEFLTNQNVALSSALTAFPSDNTFTTFKMRTLGQEQCRTIDYIFYSHDTLRLCALLHMPSVEELPFRLPATNYPSDHLAIAASFEFL